MRRFNYFPIGVDMNSCQMTDHLHPFRVEEDIITYDTTDAITANALLMTRIALDSLNTRYVFIIGQCLPREHHSVAQVTLGILGAIGF